jgi:pilus assembly protein CpaB
MTTILRGLILPVQGHVMKPARLVILIVAIVAAGLAGVLAMRLAGDKGVSQQVADVIRREPTVNVLVSAENLAVGSRLTENSIRWMAWPQGGIAEGFITDAARPQAIQELVGLVVRLPMFASEPVRAEKVADSSNRIMSSLLPSGKRAVATEISVATGAGGFVLPNDRVDVIMVRRNEEGRYLTETVLNNIRILAIDQQVEEKDDGTRSVIGTTATLELTPDQARVITVAQQMAERLTLALRSVADAQETDTKVADYLLTGSDGKAEVQVIKSGTIVRAGATASVQR